MSELETNVDNQRVRKKDKATKLPKPMLTHIFDFSWTKICSLERQLLIVFVVEVASV